MAKSKWLLAAIAGWACMGAGAQVIGYGVNPPSGYQQPAYPSQGYGNGQNYNNGNWGERHHHHEEEFGIQSLRDGLNDLASAKALLSRAHPEWSQVQIAAAGRNIDQAMGATAAAISNEGRSAVARPSSQGYTHENAARAARDMLISARSKIAMAPDNSAIHRARRDALSYIDSAKRDLDVVVERYDRHGYGHGNGYWNNGNGNGNGNGYNGDGYGNNGYDGYRH